MELCIRRSIDYSDTGILQVCRKAYLQLVLGTRAFFSRRIEEQMVSAISEAPKKKVFFGKKEERASDPKRISDPDTYPAMI